MSQENPGPMMKTFTFLSTVWIALPIVAFQNILGMYLNLWLDFSRFSSVPKAFASAPMLDFHVAVGILILTIASGRFAAAFSPKARPFLVPAFFIFIFAVVAFASGVVFTFFGHHDIFSFTMEFGFAGILVSAAALIYVAIKGQGMRGQAQAVPKGPGQASR